MTAVPQEFLDFMMGKAGATRTAAVAAATPIIQAAATAIPESWQYLSSVYGLKIRVGNYAGSKTVFWQALRPDGSVAKAGLYTGTQNINLADIPEVQAYAAQGRTLEQAQTAANAIAHNYTTPAAIALVDARPSRTPTLPATNPLAGIVAGIGAIGSGITSGVAGFTDMLFKPRTPEELARYDRISNTPMIGLNVNANGGNMSQLDDIRNALGQGASMLGAVGGGAAGKPKGKNIIVMPDGSVKKLVSPATRTVRRSRRRGSGAGTAAIRRLENQIQQQQNNMMMMLMLAGRS